MGRRDSREPHARAGQPWPAGPVARRQRRRRVVQRVGAGVADEAGRRREQPRRCVRYRRLWRRRRRCGRRERPASCGDGRCRSHSGGGFRRRQGCGRRAVDRWQRRRRRNQHFGWHLDRRPDRRRGRRLRRRRGQRQQCRGQRGCGHLRDRNRRDGLCGPVGRRRWRHRWHQRFGRHRRLYQDERAEPGLRRRRLRGRGQHVGKCHRRPKWSDFRRRQEFEGPARPVGRGRRRCRRAFGRGRLLRRGRQGCARRGRARGQPGRQGRQGRRRGRCDRPVEWRHPHEHRRRSRRGWESHLQRRRLCRRLAGDCRPVGRRWRRRRRHQRDGGRGAVRDAGRHRHRWDRRRRRGCRRCHRGARLRRR